MPEKTPEHGTGDTGEAAAGRIGFTRRRVLGGAAAGGAALASLALPGNVRKALADPLPMQNASLSDIKHVVLLMQENRSFDHYFGTMAGVRGYGDPHVLIQSNGKSVFYQNDPSNPDGYLLPYHLDSLTTAAQAIPSMSHAWQVQHSAWNGGLMDN
jgi:phospholipase C